MAARRKKEIPAIICAGENGRAVIYGYVDALPDPGQPVAVRRAKMVLYWPRECGGLLGLAANGPRDGLRLTAAVEETRCTARQSVTVGAYAAEAMDEWAEA